MGWEKARQPDGVCAVEGRRSLTLASQMVQSLITLYIGDTGLLTDQYKQAIRVLYKYTEHE